MRPSQQENTQTTSWKSNHSTHILVFAIIIILTLLPYFQVRNHEFVDLDDYDYIVQNHHVRNGFTIEGLVWAFKIQHDGNSYWRPLTWVSHMLDFELFGDDPGWHHLVNLFLHICNGLLLYALLFFMTGKSINSAAVALLFAIHPINVESVAWVTERSNVLCTNVGLWTLLLYVHYTRHPSTARFISVIGAFLLCVMVKPILVTLPFLMALLDFWPLNRFGHVPSENIERRAELCRLIGEKAVLILVSLLAVWLTLHRQGRTISAEQVSLELRLANAVVSYIQYLFHLVYPINLTAFYPFPKLIPPWKIIGALVVLVSVSGAVVLRAKKWPYLFVGWFWFTGTMFPKIGLVQAGLWPALADRWAYFPTIGLFIAFSWGVSNLYEKKSKFSRKLMLIPSLAVCILLVGLTWVQVDFWTNSTQLFERMLEKTSGNFMAHNNLGTVLLDKVRIGEAEMHFLKAIELNPSFEIAYKNLGEVYRKYGDYDNAEAYYRKAIAINPLYYAAHISLGNLFLRSNKFTEAWQSYTEALKINSDGVLAYNGLGGVLAKIGRFDEAKKMFQAAITIDPGYAPAKQNLERVATAQQTMVRDSNGPVNKRTSD